MGQGHGPPLANAAWQLVFGFLFIAAGTFVFEGVPHLWPARADAAIFAILYRRRCSASASRISCGGRSSDRLPTITASLGSLLVPVIGVTASAVMLDERPTLPDIVGFAADLRAAACVLLQPTKRNATPLK